MKQLVNDSAAAALAPLHPVLAMGTFDGVHLGHQALIARTRSLARQAGVPAWVLTFDPHPAQITAPERAPKLIGSLEQRLRWLEETGLDATWIQRFDGAFAALKPEAFVETVVSRVTPSALVVGHDFGFGKRRAGRAEDLQKLAQALGVAVEVVAPVRVDTGEIVSSTAIRSCLQEGDLAGASQRLGRPVEVEGQICSGAGRGAGLGFATANLVLPKRALPARGVYAAWAVVEGRRYAAALNIGVAPTFGDLQEEILEAHLLGHPGGSLEGKRLRINFVQRLRGERTFASVDALRTQVGKDLAALNRLLGLDGDV